MELIEENAEELSNLAAGKLTTMTVILKRILLDIKTNGKPFYLWEHLKILLSMQLKECLDLCNSEVSYQENVNETYEERKNRLSEILLAFEAAPFTLQRMVEVILEPSRYHRNINKLMNGIEKLLSVSSTISMIDPREIEFKNHEVDQENETVAEENPSANAGEPPEEDTVHAEVLEED